jgi:hypothetical protein
MSNQPYDPGDLEGQAVKDLTPKSQQQFQLTPETIVVVINRSRDTLVRKFDGTDYDLSPGLMRMPYGAALHFQRHCTVPGTRDVFNGSEQSYIGIRGVDPPEWCEPFTNEQLERFGLATEAISREGDEVQTASVANAAAAGRIGIRNQSANRRPVRQVRNAAGDELDVDEVMAGPAEGELNDAQTQMQADAAGLAESRAKKR